MRQYWVEQRKFTLELAEEFKIGVAAPLTGPQAHIGGDIKNGVQLAVDDVNAAGLTIDWSDFAELSSVVPLLARIYPNGKADVNHFHAAGGMGTGAERIWRARAEGG